MEGDGPACLSRWKSMRLDGKGFTMTDRRELGCAPTVSYVPISVHVVWLDDDTPRTAERARWKSSRYRLAKQV